MYYLQVQNTISEERNLERTKMIVFQLVMTEAFEEELHTYNQ